MRSRHGKNKQQTLYPLHSKIKANPVLHSSYFQPTATASKNFGFFDQKRGLSGCSYAMWVATAVFTKPRGCTQCSQQSEGLQPRGLFPGHHFFHLLQGSIPYCLPAHYTNPELPLVHTLYFRQLKQALKDTHNYPKICCNIRRKLKLHVR